MVLVLVFVIINICYSTLHINILFYNGQPNTSFHICSTNEKMFFVLFCSFVIAIFFFLYLFLCNIIQFTIFPIQTHTITPITSNTKRKKCGVQYVQIYYKRVGYEFLSLPGFSRLGFVFSVMFLFAFCF